MTPKSFQMPTTLIRVGEDITALAGQHLIVANNIVIGVYTGDVNIGATLSLPAAAKAPEVRDPTPKPSRSHHRAKPPVDKVAQKRYFTETREKFLEGIPKALRETPYLNLHGLAKHFNILKGSEMYLRLGTTLRDMRSNNLIASYRTGISNVSVVYHLVDQPPPSVKVSDGLFSQPDRAADSEAAQES